MESLKRKEPYLLPPPPQQETYICTRPYFQNLSITSITEYLGQKILVLLIFLILVAGSVSGCDNNFLDPFEKQIQIIDDIFDHDHYITSDDTTSALQTSSGNNLYIRSNRSTITILTNSVLGDVYIEGNNCIIIFEHPISINSLNFEGSDNVVNVPDNSGISIDSDSGSGNILIKY